MWARTRPVAMPRLNQAQRALRARLHAHVHQLARSIGQRHLWCPGTLEAAARYLEAQLAETGLDVNAQTFTASGQAVRNIEAVHPGCAAAENVLVLGAHYDTVLGCPGANDNGTGCAALVEIARAVATRALPSTVRFVAFVNEEPPFFQTADMGSAQYAASCRARDDSVAGMISLETIGYYDDARGSQHYPLPLHVRYPTSGHFVAFVGNLRSAAFLRRAVAAYRRAASVPAESAALPAVVPGVGWSDHWAFWQHGWPAIMVTDTAPYRYPHYHSPSDTPDKIDFDRFTLVVEGLACMVHELAGGELGGPM
jgi:Zn-dependent M28 family amino/carboxypeptidase